MRTIDMMKKVIITIALISTVGVALLVSPGGDRVERRASSLQAHAGVVVAEKGSEGQETHG